VEEQGNESHKIRVIMRARVATRSRWRSDNQAVPSAWW